jgi:branched-chain amino acid transport system ATP-binding protein
MLNVSDLNAWQGRSQVLHGVSLDVAAGEIVCLLGRNGAGRSSTLQAIMGQLRAEGAIHYQGEQLLGLKPFEIARRGLAYVPEARSVFADLSVEDNLLLGAPVGRRAQRWGVADMYELFEALGRRRQVAAGLLSGGEQQMLSLCRALMGNPDLMLVDEPTEGLAPAMVERISAFLQHLRGLGMAVLLVEQKLDMALDISDRVVLLGHGRVVHAGTPQTLRAQAGLMREWLMVPEWPGPV